MYTLTHNGDKIGTTKLERGDPAARVVSGVFRNTGGAKPLANFIKSIGGVEEDGVSFIALNESFKLTDQDGNVVTFEEGTLIAIPDDNEVFIDLEGISESDYKTYFSEHILAMNSNT